MEDNASLLTQTWDCGKVLRVIWVTIPKLLTPPCGDSLACRTKLGQRRPSLDTCLKSKEQIGIGRLCDGLENAGRKYNLVSKSVVDRKSILVRHPRISATETQASNA